MHNDACHEAPSIPGDTRPGFLRPASTTHCMPHGMVHRRTTDLSCQNCNHGMQGAVEELKLRAALAGAAASMGGEGGAGEGAGTDGLLDALKDLLAGKANQVRSLRKCDLLSVTLTHAGSLMRD